MKKLLLFIAIASVVAVTMVACNTNPSAVKGLAAEDTAGLAQFQAWKAMNERVSIEETFGNRNEAVAQTVYKKPAATRTKTVVMNSSSTHEAKVAKKKGWSKAAKYAVIGGGSGAVLGAVINKKDRVKGGVVGTVVLGGLGYIIGRSEDKKDGRY